MLDQTRDLWEKQNGYDPHRWRLFAAVQEQVNAERVLYPGCYVDIAASFVFPSVTYIDTDKRAARFFADREGIAELIRAHPEAPPTSHIDFLAADYTGDLDLPVEGFDLLISLYAGFVSEACTYFLRVGGRLLVNPSHADAALASLDPRYRLEAVVLHDAGSYRVTTQELDSFLVPRSPKAITVDSVRASGRAVPYTREAFAYLFQRVA